MPADKITTLLLGDVFGDSGCRAIFSKLKSLRKKYKADFVIVNGENAYNGLGMSEENVNLLLQSGADVITSGNHIWQNDEIYPVLERLPNLLRPANFGQDAPGHGSCIVNSIGVINLQGRFDMKPIEDPFKTALSLIEKMKGKTDAIFVDFHAESPEEKEALAYFLDSKVTAVVGTHTHVQTADERILAGGTAYITDLGMCGPENGVIGCNAEAAIKMQIAQFPSKVPPATGEGTLSGVVIQFNPETGKALSIQRIVE